MKKLLTSLLVFCLCITACGCELDQDEINSLVSQVKNEYELSSPSSTPSVTSKKPVSTPSQTPSSKKNKTNTSTVTKVNTEEKSVNKYGNTAGNLYLGGHATIQGDYTYFTTESGVYVSNGPKVKKLSDDAAYMLNIYGDWLYYKTDGKECYRINIKGGEREVFLKDALTVYIADGWVYYETYAQDGLHRIKTDKTQYKHIIKDHNITNLNIIDDKIYWGNNIDLYVANTDGSNIKHYVDVGSQNLVIYKGLKYTSGNLDKENIDGTNSQTLVDSGAMNINIQDDWIYFIYYEKDEHLCKIKIDGSGLTELTDHGVISFSVVGEYIYYSPLASYEADGHTYGWSNGYRRMRLDGSDNIKLK